MGEMPMDMPEAEVDATLRPWGNSMGVIIPADVVRRLNLQPGATIHLRLEYTPERNDADRLPNWEFVTEIGDADIDEILEEEWGEKNGV